MNKQPLVEEKLKEMFREIIQENHDRPMPKPIRAKCNDCQHRVPKTVKCRLLYPNGIPKEILMNKTNCEGFKQK